MGMHAYLMGMGPFAQSIADCLEYPAEYYNDVSPGQIVFAAFFLCRTSDASRRLAEAMGTKAEAMGRHEILTGLIRGAARYDGPLYVFLREHGGGVDHEPGDLVKLARLGRQPGWRFFYRPEM